MPEYGYTLRIVLGDAEALGPEVSEDILAQLDADSVSASGTVLEVYGSTGDKASLPALETAWESLGRLLFILRAHGVTDDPERFPVTYLRGQSLEVYPDDAPLGEVVNANHD